MKRRRVNIMCLQETRWTGEGARGLVLGYKIVERGHVIEVYQKNDKLIRVKLLCGKEILNVISAYAPQVGLDTEEKRQSWEDLDEVVLVSQFLVFFHCLTLFSKTQTLIDAPFTPKRNTAKSPTATSLIDAPLGSLTAAQTSRPTNHWSDQPHKCPLKFQPITKGLKDLDGSIKEIRTLVRWNSTFLMLESAIKFKKSFASLCMKDSACFKELRKVGGSPTEEYWNKPPCMSTTQDCFSSSNATSIPYTSNVPMRSGESGSKYKVDPQQIMTSKYERDTGYSFINAGKTELEKYLEDACEQFNSSFDILA
uniref:Uncharacterized protein n=1 Tax=Chenopodium quinoa TaxID=63459 RepID=A0A803MK39_CHEQI